MGMTYKKLYEDALFKLEHNKITLGEFEEMTKPLDREVEQEPTTKNNLVVDCIDRAKAQTEIEMNASRYTIAKERGGTGQVEWSDQLIKVSDAVDIIRHLPPVTPQEPKWIPVSERLPKNRGFYLVSTTDCITIMEFISGWISQNIGLCNGYVKAWMPLPQPYKAKREAADGNNYI